MKNNTPTHPWIEAMRLRTLPVSCAGVVCGCGIAAALHGFKWLPALICFLFAVLAQIASNFANEYFDYRNGLDKKGREGFRRGVTEGDISPRAMLTATLITLAIACLLGLSLIYWGGWTLLPIGILIAVCALAYSAGPYPLSHHGLGEITVIIFFGILPVTLTAWIQIPDTQLALMAFPASVGVGLMAANVLIVNNYRDADDDKAVGKRTSVVIIGRKYMRYVYLFNLILGVILIGSTSAALAQHSWAQYGLIGVALAACGAGANIWKNMGIAQGAELNPLLKQTAQLLLIYTIVTTILSIL